MPKAEFERAQLVTQEVTPREYDALQAQVEEFVGQLHTTVPFLDGVLLQDISLTPFVDNVINHKLDRKLRGWFIVRDSGREAAFHARRSASKSINASSHTNFEPDTEFYDIGANYDHTTNFEFVAPVAGEYWFAAQVALLAIDDASVEAQIAVGGTSKLLGGLTRSSATAGGNASHVSGILHLAEGDQVTARVFHNDGAARNVHNDIDQSYFMGRLIRETWDDQDNNADEETSLILQTTYAHTVDLWVF